MRVFKIFWRKNVKTSCVYTVGTYNVYWFSVDANLYDRLMKP